MSDIDDSTWLFFLRLPFRFFSKHVLCPPIRNCLIIHIGGHMVESFSTPPSTCLLHINSTTQFQKLLMILNSIALQVWLLLLKMEQDNSVKPNSAELDIYNVVAVSFLCFSQHCSLNYKWFSFFLRAPACSVSVYSGKWITSKQGQWGIWRTEVECPKHYVIVGAQATSEKEAAVGGDNSAGNIFATKCSIFLRHNVEQSITTSNAPLYSAIAWIYIWAHQWLLGVEQDGNIADLSPNNKYKQISSCIRLPTYINLASIYSYPHHK